MWLTLVSKGRVIRDMSRGNIGCRALGLSPCSFILRAAGKPLGDFQQRVDTVALLLKCHLESIVRVDLKGAKQNKASTQQAVFLTEGRDDAA